ncbi:BREX-1 system phosphatase PglZ type A [Lacticaseibacillus sp. GG6-2]
MAELELAQVVTGIEALFTESNHFVFWYDEQGDFKDNIPAIADQLEQKVIVMNEGTQFATKLQLTTLEREGQSALVYSPAPRPAIELNLLEDFLRYSKTYAADALTMLQEELGLQRSDRAFLEKYASFFASKERKQRFVKLNYNHQPLELVLLAALAKASTPALGAILQVICRGSLDEDNETLALFAKYGALDVFWDFVERAYGFSNTHRTPLYLFAAMLLNMAYDQADRELPTSLSAYALSRANNAVTFIQNTRNLISGQPAIQQIATAVWDFVHGQTLFGKMEPAQLARIDAFPQIDGLLSKWVTERILADDYDVRINRQSLTELISSRLTMAYGTQYASAYAIQRDALAVLTAKSATSSADLATAIDQYVNTDYQIDTNYREFTAACAVVDPAIESLTEGIQAKVENAYLNDFLTPSIRDWNTVYSPDAVPSDAYQRNFYRQYVSIDDDRTLVLISDAFRFEAARALQDELDARDVMTTEMHRLITGLPSVTYFGMPALLPNRDLQYTDDKKVLVDGQLVDNTEKRQQVLQATNPDSVAGLVKDFVAMTSQERKDFLNGQKVVYLYDNRVDTTGEKSVTEQEVFAATARAIDNLARTIEILRNVSVRHIIVTADHGYIYRHSALDSANKIEVSQQASDAAGVIKKEQRYVLSERPLEVVGTAHQQLGALLGNDDTRWVNYPKNFDIFQAPGPSQNYVHGGSSAQEMIVPVLDVRTASGRSSAEPARLHDVTAARRITARDVVVQLMQDDAVGELVTAANYQVYFVDDRGEKISGVRRVAADSRETLPTDRIQRVRLTLKDAKYTNGRKYTLIIRNDDTDQQLETSYTMDMVIGGGFGFDI